MIDFNEHFNNSYERINVNSDFFFDEFYNEFLGRSESFKELFAGVDMDRQKKMLKKGLFYLVTFYATKKAGDSLVHLADDHYNQLKLTEEHYKIWMDSLIATLKKVDRKFDKNAEIGWRITLSPGLEFMQHYFK